MRLPARAGTPQVLTVLTFRGRRVHAARPPSLSSTPFPAQHQGRAAWATGYCIGLRRTVADFHVP